MTSLTDKRLVFVTGKGGVGKSTVAMALAVAATRQGRRAIVAEVSSQEQASQIYDRDETGHNEVELDENLFSISIDPDRMTHEYLTDQIPVPGVGEMLHRSKIFSYLAAATPGLSELVTIGKVWELAQSPRRDPENRTYDTVVVDAPATGHGVGFLQTPANFAEIARAGPIHNQAKVLARFLADPEKTGVAIVARPEEMAINETISLERRLADEVGIETDLILMNGMYPRSLSDEETSKLEAVPAGAPDPIRIAVDAALSMERRAADHAAQRQRLAGDAKARIHDLPFFFDPDPGPATIAELAEALA